MHASGYDFASFSEFESCTCLYVAGRCMKFALRVRSTWVEALLASTPREYLDCEDFSMAGLVFLPAQFLLFWSWNFGERNNVIEHGRR